MLKSAILRFVVFFFFCAWTGNASAATFYVATSGNDMNAGSQSSPFRTIKRGITALSGGDTLYVRGGTYSEAILTWETRIPAGSSWDKPTTISALTGETVTILPPSGKAAFWLKDSTLRYLVIKGFVIDGQTVAYHGIKIHGATNYIRVTDCEIKNSKYSGLLINENSNHTQLIRVNSHHNGTDNHDHGVYLESSYNLIENSEFHYNSGWGIHVYNGYTGQRADSNVIRNNVSNHNGTRSIAFGIILSSGSNNMAYNNIVTNNSGGGIQVDYRSPQGNQVLNNTIYGNGGYGINVGAGSSQTVVRNNIVFQNSGGIRTDAPDATASNNLLTSPGFMNPTAGDFRLQSGSLAIDAGRIVPDVAFDFAGFQRPQGASHDIGAYEYGSATSVPVAPSNVRILPIVTQ